MKMRRLASILSVLTFLQAGCHREQPATITLEQTLPRSGASRAAPAMDACSLVLVPHAGQTKVDQEILLLQKRVSQTPDPARLLERLGWLFISKARTSFDPGFYTLAEQCAVCLESKDPQSLEALLLRGHSWQSLHRFKEAEGAARQLVAKRALACDYGLLGDTLMDQGRVDEAGTAYQQMMDLKPDLHAYARGAQFRWIKGDLAGALELMRMSAQASSPRDPESAAWVFNRLAHYEWQAGSADQALRTCEAALRLQEDYAPALLTRGRILLAKGQATNALPDLQRARELNPLPEYEWALAEALRSAGPSTEADGVESQLVLRGPVEDPRTSALYLATRGRQVETALRLARKELADRQDVFTHDAVAWALAAAGQFQEAEGHMLQALAEGTQDARLFYHAGVISAELNQKEEARRWCGKAVGLQQTLLPSEREGLAARQRALGIEQVVATTASPTNGVDLLPARTN